MQRLELEPDKAKSQAQLSNLFRDAFREYPVQYWNIITQFYPELEASATSHLTTRGFRADNTVPLQPQTPTQTSQQTQPTPVQTLSLDWIHR